MAPQAWILLSCTLVSVFMQSRGMTYEIARSLDSKICARLSCINDINADVSTYTTKALNIYDVNDKGVRTKLAYIDLDKPSLVIDSSRGSVVNGTGHIAANHVDVVLDFTTSADCQRGIYVCEVVYAGVKGTTEVISETIVPGEQSGECSCSTITEQFATLTTRANGINSQVYTQREVNSDLFNEVRGLRQDLNERQNDLGKLTQVGAILRESINVQIQNNKDNQEQIAALQRSNELIDSQAATLQSNDEKQAQALAEQRSQDEANSAAIANLKQVDDTVQANLNARKRADAGYADTIKQLKRNDDSLENQVDDVSRSQRSVQEQINTLQQSDNSQASDIKALQSTNDAQAQAISQLTGNFEAQLNRVNQLQEADATFKAQLEAIAKNNTAFDAAILDLRRNSQQTRQDLAALRKKNQVTENQISLLQGNDARYEKDITALSGADTIIQRRLNDLLAADTAIRGAISGLQSKDATYSGQIAALIKANAAQQARISNQSAVYQSLRAQITIVTQKNVQLLQQLADFNDKIDTLRHYIKASQVTTVVRTTTKLRTIPCVRGAAYTSPRQAININGVSTLCDTETDGGGWVLVERRQKADKDFSRAWEDYRRGFGSVDSNYFLGLDPLRSLNDQGFHELRVDFTVNGKKYYAHYDNFDVGGPDSYYKLNVKGYSGNAGDSLSELDGAGFSTPDADHDNDDKNCAEVGGGFWYKNCQPSVNAADGIYWKALGNEPVSDLEIKVRNAGYKPGSS